VKTKILYQVVNVDRDTKRPFYYNKQQGLIKMVEKSGLDIFHGHGDGWRPLSLGDEINTPLLYEGVMAVESKQTGHHYAVLQNTLPSGEVIDELRVELLAFNLGLDIDADRDGEVGFDEPEGQLGLGQGAARSDRNGKQRPRFVRRDAWGERSFGAGRLANPTD
jgi:hypothetical protein